MESALVILPGIMLLMSFFMTGFGFIRHEAGGQYKDDPSHWMLWLMALGCQALAIYLMVWNDESLQTIIGNGPKVMTLFDTVMRHGGIFNKIWYFFCLTFIGIFTVLTALGPWLPPPDQR